MARRKSFKIGGGTRINLSKSGIGVSTRVKGFRVSAGPRGTRLTTKNPLTGTRHSTSLSPKRGRRATAPVAAAAQPASDLITHYYVVRLSTTRLNHDKEVASIVRAMGKKKWSLHSQQTTPGASKETVSVLTFAQATKKKKAPNAPVKGSVTKKGGLLSRMFG